MSLDYFLLFNCPSVYAYGWLSVCVFAFLPSRPLSSKSFLTLSFNSSDSLKIILCHSIKPFNFWLPILYNKIYSIPWIYDIYPTYTIDIQGILVIFYIYLRNVLKIESKWKKTIINHKK